VQIGIAFDLKSDFEPIAGAPDDRLEEYDSLATVDSIAAALSELGHEPLQLGGGRTFVERALGNPVDLVFNIAEGRGSRSREAHVPAVCEMLGIPFTHSDPLTLALTLDKALAKRVAGSLGVHTPRFAVVKRVRDALAVDLAYPLIAKPLFEGSSMGIRKSSRVESVDELAREIERIAHGYEQPILVEEFCSGPEFSVGVLGTGAKARALGMMEIIPKVDRPTEFVYSLEVKRDWERQVEYHVPPRRDAKLLEAVTKLALDAHRALECRDVSRVDIRLDAEGRPCFLEINPLPGLSPATSDLCIVGRGMGVSFVQLIDAIVGSALERHEIG
jgi:D-alanine-D-alanine ligase